MSIFHPADQSWQHETDVPYSRFPFGVECPFVWNGEAWVRWYGKHYTATEVETYTSLSSAFICDTVKL